MSWKDELKEYVLDARYDSSALPTSIGDYIITCKVDISNIAYDKVISIGYLGAVLWDSFIGTKITGLEYLEETSELGCIGGWRLIGRNPLYYTAIGNNAIDISHSDVESDEYGASGVHSFASGEYTISSGIASSTFGLFTIAKNNNSVTIGKYNIGTSDDTIFEIGVGVDGARANAFEVYNDGSLIAPEFSITEIDTLKGRALVTVEYLEYIIATLPSSGLVNVDATNISSVKFILSDDSIITTSFAHVHSEYALQEWTLNIIEDKLSIGEYQIVYGTGDDITSNNEFIYNNGKLLVGYDTFDSYNIKVEGTGFISTSLTTPTINLTTGATLDYIWQCTNATTGAGHWAEVSTNQRYVGIWDADTNTPTLVDGTGTAGDFYRVIVAGTQDLGSGSITFEVGDDVMYNGTIWERLPGPTIVGNELSRVNDTNVTLTLTGSPTTALLEAAGITVGWTGTLADTRIEHSSIWNTAYGNMITDMSFNTSDGILTLTQQDAGTITEDLDGRYLLIADVEDIYLDSVDATNISNVTFKLNDDTEIITSFSHVHTEYALLDWVLDNYIAAGSQEELVVGNGLSGNNYDGQTEETISVGSIVSSPTGTIYTN